MEKTSLQDRLKTFRAVSFCVDPGTVGGRFRRPASIFVDAPEAIAYTT